MDESPSNFTEGKEPDAKGHLLCDCIYRICWGMQTDLKQQETSVAACGQSRGRDGGLRDTR